MKFDSRVLGLCAAALLVSSVSFAGEDKPVVITPKTIYGQDNRMDVKDVNSQVLRKMADSTVALFRKQRISINPNTGIATLALSPYARDMNLCATERFVDQLNGAFCSGTLVGPDTVLTAGHCITSEMDCANTAFVFGFAVNTANQTPRRVSANEVYTCASIIARDAIGTGPDYAVVKLDRVVPNHSAMRINRGVTQQRDELVLIGYPSGLPAKIAVDARVRKPDTGAGFFVATTDSFAGNSGSGVFNARTGLLEGVLVRGDTDFIRTQEGCMVSNVCDVAGCRGEDVTSARVFARFISQR